MTIREYDDFNLWLNNRIEHGKTHKHCDAYKELLADKTKAYELWTQERERFNLEGKRACICNTLETLKARGVAAKLANYDNCCITANSKSGKHMTFYANTGTIAGYGGTPIKGIDKFIELLEVI